MDANSLDRLDGSNPSRSLPLDRGVDVSHEAVRYCDETESLWFEGSARDNSTGVTAGVQTPIGTRCDRACRLKSIEEAPAGFQSVALQQRSSGLNTWPVARGELHLDCGGPVLANIMT